jgi:chromosome partitioning protein
MCCSFPSNLVQWTSGLWPTWLAYAVLNSADPGETSTDNTETIEALKEYQNITLLPAIIRRRKAFANATGQGLHVSEISPRDPKAADELNALVLMLF